MPIPAKIIHVNFKNYSSGQVPQTLTYSGIYYVCAMTESLDKKSDHFGRLLYIGETGEEDGIYGRYQSHTDKDVWSKELHEGEHLGFFAAEIGAAEDRLRAEAALIYKFRPPLNTKNTISFGYPATRIVLTNVWNLQRTVELLGEYDVCND